MVGGRAAADGFWIIVISSLQKTKRTTEAEEEEDMEEMYLCVSSSVLRPSVRVAGRNVGDGRSKQPSLTDTPLTTPPSSVKPYELFLFLSLVLPPPHLPSKSATCDVVAYGVGSETLSKRVCVSHSIRALQGKAAVFDFGFRCIVRNSSQLQLQLRPHGSDSEVCVCVCACVVVVSWTCLPRSINQASDRKPASPCLPPPLTLFLSSS